MENTLYGNQIILKILLSDTKRTLTHLNQTLRGAGGLFLIKNILQQHFVGGTRVTYASARSQKFKRKRYLRFESKIVVKVYVK